LTGRENIFLNGAILGMCRHEIARKFDAIVAFSEIADFLDTPVKRYSSGMHVRLAFAVAAHLEPEILLVDEVLAVGDAVFQRKCLGKMSDVARKGRTVLFVSHNMGAMTKLCTRGVWLDRGQLRLDGDIEHVVSSYLANDTRCDGEITFPSDSVAPGSSDVRLCAVRVVNQDGRITSSLDARHPFHIEVEYEVLRELSDLRIGIRLVTHDGTSIVTSTDGDESGHEFLRTPGKYISRCTVPGCFLNYGQYFITVGSDFPLRKVHFSLDPALAVQVEHTGGVGGNVLDGRKGILRMQLPWVRTVLRSCCCEPLVDNNN
jgi:lipopolysaccharide transport system ATP-binding protein